MANKKQMAKDEQGYTSFPMTCSNCGHFASDKIERSASFSWSKPFFTEKNLRCTIGGFAVKRMATCKRHVFCEIAKD